MSVELQKISGFLLFLVMKYVSGTAEDQWFSPVPCDEVCQWNCRRSVVFSFITRNRRKPLIFCSSTDILHHKEQEKTTDLLQFH
jgi:hypothetical protein